MPLDYYEALDLSPGATVQEIEAAYEARYHYWRRLVTHHDPQTVEKAQQALRLLEQIYNTLTDPAQRQAYNTSIGVSPSTGGLMDPTARPLVPSHAPPPSSVVSTPTPEVEERVDVWICSQCQVANAVGHQFCQECGHRIGTQCPTCRQMVQVNAQYCPACGVNIKEAIHKKEMEEIEQARREKEAAREAARQKAQQELEQRKLSEIKIGLAVMGGVVGAIAALVGWTATWPEMMESGCCIAVQLVIGAIGGVISTQMIADQVKSPSGAGWVWPVGFIVAIIGGYLALPVVVLGFVASLFG